ncbi:TRAP transporter fused permease subunit [Plantactinospora sp. KLBMP9567]|uniref:TRAP transporter permease n=1 Tax=Plantactinospora sp. KLBMP9567 TaxID=3085900 RepID=UPI00298237C5|nr:TRAP transporter fused permease subunit [Plantactinospora sp. KLBMP9567]MDW5326784.1 TRAP transporter fused permease subunit [Plantactinospora sp. KLBMP9567]
MPDGVAKIPPATGAGPGPDRPAETSARQSERPAETSTRDPDRPAETSARIGRDELPALATPDVATAVTYDDEERPARQLRGPVEAGVAVVAFAVALLVLGQVFRPLSQGSQFYLIVFLTGVLPLVFLAYRSGLRLPDRLASRLPAVGPRRVPDPDAPAAARRDLPTAPDWLLAGLALVVCLYPVLPVAIGDAGGGYDAFLDRQGLLVPVDVLMGALLLVLLIEACRRTTGWILPVVCLLFLGYGYYGGLLPQSWAIAHAGLDFGQIVDALYNSGSGFYGTPLDVAATYIVLFTIYGAVLDLSGAGRFFVDLSVAAFRRSRSAAGRTAVASGFLLGTVSGSGTATAVSVGAVTWPILRRAGYPAEHAGGMLAAAGVGAILSPPTLGAAAFIVAEYLEVSYLTVLGWAVIPTLLYYLGILLAVEIDARRFKVRPVEVATGSAWRLLGRFGYHFSSLIVIVVLLAVGLSATRAVVYATGLAVLLSFLDRRNWLTPRRIFTALSAGVRGVLPVAAVCGAAGIITATTTKTGLGAQFASLLVRGAEALTDNPTVVLALTVVFAAVALSLLGLAVPVTASFIIGWVIIGPALLALGVPAPAAAMFVFYYSVLSEVTPPTALAAVGAAAITGGRTVPTMWQALKYALPAFLAPIAFVLTGPGEYLLGRGSPVEVLWAGLVGCLGVAALAVATGGWLLGVGPAGAVERALSAVAGLLLLYLHPVSIAIGGTLVAVAVLATLARRRRTAGTRSVVEEAVPQEVDPVVPGARGGGDRHVEAGPDGADAQRSGPESAPVPADPGSRADDGSRVDDDTGPRGRGIGSSVGEDAK